MNPASVNNNNDKLALIKLAKSVVNHLKQSQTKEEIALWLKNEYNFTDEFIEQIL